jgi:hypothetical protein
MVFRRSQDQFRERDVARIEVQRSLVGQSGLSCEFRFPSIGLQFAFCKPPRIDRLLERKELLLQLVAHG